MLCVLPLLCAPEVCNNLNKKPSTLYVYFNSVSLFIYSYLYTYQTVHAYDKKLYNKLYSFFACRLFRMKRLAYSQCRIKKICPYFGSFVKLAFMCIELCQRESFDFEGQGQLLMNDCETSPA
jgi:hypothetical protein